MAMQAIRLDREKLSCSICLDLLKDPATLGCGHTYCMSCIKDCWDEERERKRTCSCPQCRQSFTPRPVLMKNIMLAELVEDLKKSGVEDAPPAHLYAGPRDKACDFCRGPKLKALKFCGDCMASFCEKHLQPHYDLAQWKKHTLYEARDSFCYRHGQELRITCYTDRSELCLQCFLEDHKDHHTSFCAKRFPWVTGVPVLEPDPVTRKDFLKYSRKITLDTNTAHSRLLLSDGNRKATYVRADPKCWDHPDRFISCSQVLCREGLTGRCYWEVEWKGKAVSIAVAHKDISRTSEEASFGNSDKSWSLECYDRGSYYGNYFCHYNKTVTSISGLKSSRIGVYLDYRKGTVSYYSVSRDMIHIYSVHVGCTQPIYPGLGLRFKGASAELCKLK